MYSPYQKQIEEQRRKRTENERKRQAAISQEITYFKQILGLKSTTPQTVVLKAIREHVDLMNNQVNVIQSVQSTSSTPQAQQQYQSASSSPLPVSPGIDSTPQFRTSVKPELLENQDGEVVALSNGDHDVSSSHVNDRGMGNDVTAVISYDGYSSESSESTRSSLPQRKRPRTLNNTSNPPSTSTTSTKIELKDVMEILTERGAKKGDKTKDQDEDGLFLSSMTPALKRMKPKQRYEVKMKIMKLIYDAEFDSQD